MTLKVAASGAVAPCAAGCTVIAEGTTEPVTLKVTAELVTLMPAALTMTRKRVPLSAMRVAGVVWLAWVAAAMSRQLAPPSLLDCHW